MRAIIGELASDGFGLVIFDRAGSHRITLAMFPDGPLLSFLADGDGAAEFGVLDEAPGIESGPYFVMPE